MRIAHQRDFELNMFQKSTAESDTLFVFAVSLETPAVKHG